jgi:hypothetical protein
MVIFLIFACGIYCFMLLFTYKSLMELAMSEKIIAANDSIIHNLEIKKPKKSYIAESLHKGCDVIQMPNGDIIITELRKLTFQYGWGNSCKMVHVKSKKQKIATCSNDDNSLPKDYINTFSS